MSIDIWYAHGLRVPLNLKYTLTLKGALNIRMRAYVNYLTSHEIGVLPILFKYAFTLEKCEHPLNPKCAE